MQRCTVSLAFTMCLHWDCKGGKLLNYNSILIIPVSLILQLVLCAVMCPTWLSIVQICVFGSFLDLLDLSNWIFGSFQLDLSNYWIFLQCLQFHLMSLEYLRDWMFCSSHYWIAWDFPHLRAGAESSKKLWKFLRWSLHVCWTVLLDSIQFTTRWTVNNISRMSSDKLYPV